MRLAITKNQKPFIIAIIVIVQLLIVSYLGIKIYQQKTNVRGARVFAPIEKKNIIINPDSELQYFYEPEPNTIENVNPWVPYKAIYTINSDSLNERFDYTTKKPDKTFRIVTLGDSYTYGLYVDTENNYSEKLEDMLNNTLSCKEYDKFEVINLGNGGYDIQYASERYKIRGQKYDPDLIVWFIKNDDMIQLNEIMLPEEKIIAEELKETGEFDKLVESGEFYPSWVRAAQGVIDTYGRENLVDIQIDFLNKFRESYTTPLLIITFPSTKDDYKKALKQFVSSQTNVLFHDEVPNIFTLEGASFPNDGHPTILGHNLIAKDLFEYLTKESLIPCD